MYNLIFRIDNDSWGFLDDFQPVPDNVIANLNGFDCNSNEIPSSFSQKDLSFRLQDIPIPPTFKIKGRPKG